MGSDQVHVRDADYTPSVQRRAAAWEWQLVPMSEADVFLHNMACLQPTSLVALAAGLRGAWVLRPDWVTTDTYDGPALKFNAAVSIKRSVWISPAFKVEQQALADLVCECARSAGSKWTVVADVEEWVHKKQHAARARQPASVVALVATRERDVYTGVDHVFGADQFFKFVAVLDQERSTLGISGM